MKINFSSIIFKRLFLLCMLLVITACQSVMTVSQNQLDFKTTDVLTKDTTETLKSGTTEFPFETPKIETSEFPTGSVNLNLIEDGTWWFSEQISELIASELIKNNPLMNVKNKNNSAYWVIEEVDQGNLPVIYEDYYIVTVPLTSLRTGVEWNVLKNCWESGCVKSNMILWVDQEDLTALKEVFGSSNETNLTISRDQPVDCNNENCLRIQNFENIEPDWRVLPIDGNSILNHSFDKNDYPLIYRLYLTINPDFPGELENAEDLVNPISNFSPSKLTSVLMTGTTALVRNLALNIENEGVNFPGKNIAEILSSADFTHISNEVPFYKDCPPAKPLRVEMRFCSDPKYIDLLKESGADVIELTGNHLLDWGPEAFQYTLNLYKENGFLTYGGGINLLKAKQPLIVEHNGNKIAFLGCNVPGPKNDWATDTRPGALKCDLEEITNRIKFLRAQGILPIMTFQDYEFEDFDPVKLLKDDFWTAAKAGAVIVSGSQAHFPQGIDSVNGAFIHYGLGNLYFDQMATWLRKATIDFHYFYNGRYINTTIIPIINENYGQPRLMDQEEANKFLQIIYQHSYYYSEE